MVLISLAVPSLMFTLLRPPHSCSHCSDPHSCSHCSDPLTHVHTAQTPSLMFTLLRLRPRAACTSPRSCRRYRACALCARGMRRTPHVLARAPCHFVHLTRHTAQRAYILTQLASLHSPSSPKNTNEANNPNNPNNLNSPNTS
jgi:hypothetical protein